ncbi:DoxX family protein [Haladaptatus halobius]|uniref:DoxX family protein n=1 Tax=Haladaptatus halobius TaxID=2884875 RepID=UPI001D0BE403|nr:DoxX family protein [Haladaptatus halobius]
MALDVGLGAILLLVGRILFGVSLAYLGLNQFMNADEMTGYAQSKGVPAAGLGVITSGVMLILGGLGIMLGVYPTIAAGMLAVFLLIVTPMMHDFWAVPEEERQDEMVNFLLNTGLLGASLIFLVLGGETWAYALNIGM